MAGRAGAAEVAAAGPLDARSTAAHPAATARRSSSRCGTRSTARRSGFRRPSVAAPPTRPGRRPPLRPYQIEWIADQFPSRLAVGEVILVPITLRNAGSLTWTWGGGNPVRLGYRYYRNRRLLTQPPERELRTDIPEDVLPGQTVVVEARIALPVEPGNYTLELDLVQEGVSWFKDEGSPVLTRWLTVEAPSAASAAAANGTDVQLPVRLFIDICARLPRSKAPYARRNLHQIRYIVVNHSGAHPHLALDRIARAHIRRGYPGIAYDFVVDPAGQIFKVTELEEVAQPDQVWSEQGVNVCLSGNFNQQAPPLPQLEAAGRLCAWLAQNVGLTADAIVGLGELIRTDSPGETFYRGAEVEGRADAPGQTAPGGAGRGGRRQRSLSGAGQASRRSAPAEPGAYGSGEPVPPAGRRRSAGQDRVGAGARDAARARGSAAHDCGRRPATARVDRQAAPRSAPLRGHDRRTRWR